MGVSRVLYVCICNALTDSDIHRAAIAGGARRPLEVFEACGCHVQCGTCVRTLVALVKQAVAGAEAAGSMRRDDADCSASARYDGILATSADQGGRRDVCCAIRKSSNI
jgi:bacterioferritin-associated ferredoxin